MPCASQPSDFASQGSAWSIGSYRQLMTKHCVRGPVMFTTMLIPRRLAAPEEQTFSTKICSEASCSSACCCS
jgi:hypothetical protein